MHQNSDSDHDSDDQNATSTSGKELKTKTPSHRRARRSSTVIGLTPLDDNVRSTEVLEDIEDFAPNDAVLSDELNARRSNSDQHLPLRKVATRDVDFMGFVANVTTGSLDLEVKRGRNFGKRSILGYLPDVFFEVVFNGLCVSKSPIVRESKEAEWNFQTSLELPHDRPFEECLLHIVVYDADGGDGDDIQVDNTLKAEVVSSVTSESPEDGKNGKGSSFKASLFSALAASFGIPNGERGKTRKVVGRCTIEGSDLLVLGSLRKIKKSMWMEILNEKGVSKGELELVGHHKPQITSHAPLAESDEVSERDERESNSAGSDVEIKSAQAKDQVGNESDNDDDDDEDTLQIQILAAKNLSKVDLLGLSDPFAVISYNQKVIGRTAIASNTLYPRWDKQIFQIYVPAGSGCTNEDGEDGELLIEMFDKSRLGSDTFLGCATISGLSLQNVLGFTPLKNKRGSIDEDSVATVSTGKGSTVTVERGFAHWFNLAKSPSKSIKENKFVKGAIQITGTYISGKLTPGEGPLSDYVPHHRVTLNILSAQQLSKTPGAITSVSKKIGFGNKKDTKKDVDECSTMCVVRWNGSEVGRTDVVHGTTTPQYHDCILIRVAPVWTLRQCELEIAVHGPPTLSGALGSFLGQTNIKGEALVRLLSGTLVDGTYMRNTFLLEKSDHYPIEDQQLVGGLLDLCGFAYFEKEGENDVVLRDAGKAGVKWDASQSHAISDSRTRRLEIHVLECTELMPPEKFGSVNSFVTITWNGREVRSTAICPHELNPKWENEVFALPIPAGVLLTDCVLDLTLQSKSRMGTITFLGTKRITGLNMERLALSAGGLVWYDLEHNKYFDEKQNAMAQGNIRVACYVYDDDGVAYIPARIADTYQPTRVNLSVLDLACMPPRIGISKMALLTSRCQPYLQFIWNGQEVGCTSPLNIPYVDLNYQSKYDWVNEEFFFIIPDDKPLVECVLQIWMWDKGVKEQSGVDTFCGMRSLSGPELHKLICSTADPVMFERRLKQARQDGNLSSLISSSPVPLALQKTWSLPSGCQSNVKGVVSIIANFVPEKQAPVLEIEDLSDIENDTVANEEDGEDGDAEALDVFDEEQASMNDEVREQSSQIVEFQNNDLEMQLTEEEKQEIIQEELDEYWKIEKLRNQILIPDGAASHFTKHYDESLGKFYYYDHVSGLTTWDKPLGKIRLFLSDQQIDKIRSRLEQRYAKNNNNQLADSNMKDVRQLVLQKMKKEKDFEIQQHKSRMKADLERKNKNIWQRVLMDASLSHGHLALSWQTIGYIDSVVFDFAANFGYPLVSLRLIGIGLSSLPDDFGSQFTQLQYLSLSNNELTYLPESFVQMTCLREINLLKNRLVKLPDKIGLMSSLQKLDIANNYLTALPVTFGALNLLQRVDLECNKLAFLPENLDNLLSCSTFICNYNELQRLPRCIGAMPSLTSLSATNNKISYIPQELTECTTLKVLRLSLNKIPTIPDKIGSLRKLKELTIDYNKLFKLPMSFYQLKKLKTLRIEGNENLTDPPPDVIGQGASAVVAYFQKRYEEDITWRQRVIISSVQAVLAQAQERNIGDPAQFEPDTRVVDSEDGWYALQLSYFWGELLPEMKRLWRDEGLRNVHNPNWLNSFPFEEREVLWAFSNFSDAYGMMLKRQKTRFRRCACVDDKGRRRPCVPPAVGFMCFRVATLLKMHFVMSGQKKERLWIAYKKAGIDEAVKTAEYEALKYLNSTVGKLWLETEAYRRAEAVLNAMGGEAQKEWRAKALEMRQNAIIAHYDKKKDHVESVRAKKAAALEQELAEVKEEWKKAKEGFMKTTLEGQMQDLIKNLANMDEHVHLARLTKECDRKCKDIVDSLYDAESTDSSDSDASLPDSDDMSEMAQLRRERYVRRYEEDLDNEKIARRRNKLSEMPLTHKEHAIKRAKELILPALSFLTGHNRERQKRRAALYKKLKRNVLQVLDVVDIRIRKFYMKLGGNFDEIQKEARHELYRQYLESNVEQARSRAKNEFDVIDQVRRSMGGVGVEKIFKAWKRWALNKLQRIRRDARAEFRTSTMVFKAAMESVEIAQARVDMWKKRTDIYSEKSFWVNVLTKEVTDEQPGLHHFLPPTFEMPDPPKPLPEGVSLETSSDESEHAYRKVKAKDNSKKARDKRAAEKKAQKTKLEAEASKKSRKTRKGSKKNVDGDSNDSSISENSSDSSSTDSSSGSEATEQVPDDVSALSESSSAIIANQSNRLPSIRPERRNSEAAHELQSGKLFISTAANDDIGALDASIRSQFTQKSAKGGKSVTTSFSSEVSLTSFNYGPDSLREHSLKIGKTPIFNEVVPAGPPVSDLDKRVQAARDYIAQIEQNSEERLREKFVLEPSDMRDVRLVSKKKAEAEVNMADRIIRKKRSGLSTVRHQTYIQQANRIQRSFEENEALRKANEVEVEVYNKPDLEQLLDLAGGDHRMTNLPGQAGMNLRTVLALRALHVEKKMHDRAVKKRLAEPKPWSIVGHYIAPIWRENAHNTDDEDSDNEEERLEAQRRKEMRKNARRQHAKEIIDAAAVEDDGSIKSHLTVDSKIPLEKRMGKPRGKQVKGDELGSIKSP